MAFITKSLDINYDVRRWVSDEVFAGLDDICFPFQLLDADIPDEGASSIVVPYDVNYYGSISTNRFYFRHMRARGDFPTKKQTTRRLSFTLNSIFYQLNTETQLFDFLTNSSEYPFRMTPDPGTESKYFNQLLPEVGLPTTGWIKTWMSPPVRGDITVSSGVEIKLAGCFTSDGSNLGAKPIMHVFVWGPTGSYEQKIVDINSVWSITTAKTMFTFFNPWTVSSPITLSDGDRIGVELMWMTSTTSGWHNHGFGYDGPTTSEYCSYIQFDWQDPVGVEFYTEIQNSAAVKYDVFNEVESETDFYYNYMSKVCAGVGLDYNIHRGGGYFDLETHSSLRGRSSLRVIPEYGVGVSAGFIDMLSSKQYYLNRWAADKASINEYFMVEDFEQFSTPGEMSASSAVVFVTDSAEAGTLSWYKTYSENQDLSEYNYMSALCDADEPTAFYATFEDASGDTTLPIYMAVKDYRGRYETEMRWLGANPETVRKISFFFEYESPLLLDDIVLLKARDDRRYINWMPLLLEDNDTTRQMKFGSIKIPDGKEVFQHFGEYNAKGSMNLRSFTNMDSMYLKTVKKERNPVYLRFKNDGLPVLIDNHHTTMINQKSNSIQTRIEVDYTEVYNSEL